MNETDSFASSVTKEECKINRCFNCNEKCLIYLLTCKVCLKQCFGQTVDELRLRWKNYNSNNRKHQRLKSCMQENLFEQFNEEGHHGFLEEVSVTCCIWLRPLLLEAVIIYNVLISCGKGVLKTKRLEEG